MKRYLPIIALFVLFAACESKPGSTQQPQEERIDSVVNVRDTSMVH